MAKTQDKEQKYEEKDRDQKRKDRKALVGRVKKVVKKSRRKLGEAKFEKELQRTIAFLEQLQATLGNSHAENSTAGSKVEAKVVAKPAKKPASKSIPGRVSPLTIKPVAPKSAVKAAKKVASNAKK